MSSGIESQSLAYFVLELAIKFQLYIPTKDITRVAIATQNYHIGVLALENVLSNAKKQAFEGEFSVTPKEGYFGLCLLHNSIDFGLG